MKRASTLVSFLLLVALQAVAQSPKSAADYNNRGLDRQAKGDPDGAIDDYTKALGLKPTGPVVAIIYNNRANARMAKNDLDGAIADYGKASELEPDNPEHYYNRGIARLTKGENEGAAGDFSKVIELSPRFVVAYNHRGNARRATLKAPLPITRKPLSKTHAMLRPFTIAAQRARQRMISPAQSKIIRKRSSWRRCSATPW